MSIDVTRSAQTLTDRVAEEIRVVMTRRRISGANLAKQLGVSPAWVSYRLTGTQPIDLNDLERIATALKVKIGDLLPRAAREVTETYPHPAGSYARPVDDSARIDRSRVDRPSGRRDHSRPGGRSAPSGPGRTSRVAA